MANNMPLMTGSMASASSSSYRRPADLNNTNITTTEGAGATMNDNLSTGTGSGVIGDIKPRSLRFTWSMKTTSSMDPADMMKEIRKVRIYLILHADHRFELNQIFISRKLDIIPH
jgi:hypothetical protein